MRKDEQGIKMKSKRAARPRVDVWCFEEGYGADDKTIVIRYGTDIV